jgi:hypothetical protein
MAVEELYPASHPLIELCYLLNLESGRTQLQFAVGFKFHGKTGHVVVDAEDALIAALKVKMLSKTNEATPVTLCADSAARILSRMPFPRDGASRRRSNWLQHVDVCVAGSKPAHLKRRQGVALIDQLKKRIAASQRPWHRRRQSSAGLG